MKAPYKIYVNIPEDYWHAAANEKTVNDVEYIRKDSLLEWLNKAQMVTNSDGIRAVFQMVINKIESL